METVRYNHLPERRAFNHRCDFSVSPPLLATATFLYIVLFCCCCCCCCYDKSVEIDGREFESSSPARNMYIKNFFFLFLSFEEFVLFATC